MLLSKFPLIFDAAIVVLKKLFDGSICDVAVVNFSTFKMRDDVATTILGCYINLLCIFQ